MFPVLWSLEKSVWSSKNFRRPWKTGSICGRSRAGREGEKKSRRPAKPDLYLLAVSSLESCHPSPFDCYQPLIFDYSLYTNGRLFYHPAHLLSGLLAVVDLSSGLPSSTITTSISSFVHTHIHNGSLPRSLPLGCS